MWPRIRPHCFGRRSFELYCSYLQVGMPPSSLAVLGFYVVCKRHSEESHHCHFISCRLHYWQGQGSAGRALFARLAPWELDLQAWILHGGRFLPIISLLQPYRTLLITPFRYSILTAKDFLQSSLVAQQVLQRRRWTFLQRC